MRLAARVAPPRSRPAAGWWPGLALLLCLAALPANGHDDRDHDAQATAVQNSGYHRDVGRHEVPDVTLVDSYGREVSIGSELRAEERAIVLQFMFTTCAGVCPLLSSVLAQAQDELGAGLDRVAMWSITIDPEVDSPEQLRLYATALGAQRQWRFFTGPRAHVVALQKAFGAYADNKMRHRPLTFLRLPDGERWVRLEGITSAADLAAECRRVIGW